ncbi:MAG: haloacid dehalogenase type II [Pseudomonadota bacterium]
MAIRAAIFDVFGTVVDWRRGIAGAVAPLFDAKGIAHPPEAFADAWRAEYQPGMEQVRSGNRGYVALDRLHRENLDRALAACNLCDAFDSTERDALNQAWGRLPAWQDSVPGISAIARYCPVAPCSNGSIALMTRLARFAGLPWDCILGADIAEAYKPQPEVYRASTAALGLMPNQVLMVAAHNADLAAARAVGLRTAFVPRRREHGSGQSTDLDPTEDWDLVAADITDLAGQIRHR